MLFLCLCVAYVLGSIPFGLIFSRVFLGTDVRTIGSGNIGATNVLRTGSKSIAAATLVCDLFKGFAVVAITLYVGLSFRDVCICSVMSVIGHVFPVWLRFKGGKGVATALGVVFALKPLLGACAGLLWILAAKIFKISSLSALIAFGILPILACFLFHSLELTILCGVFFGILLCTHRSNIYRLIKGQENRL